MNNRTLVRIVLESQSLGSRKGVEGEDFMQAPRLGSQAIRRERPITTFSFTAPQQGFGCAYPRAAPRARQSVVDEVR